MKDPPRLESDNNDDNDYSNHRTTTECQDGSDSRTSERRKSGSNIEENVNSRSSSSLSAAAAELPMAVPHHLMKSDFVLNPTFLSESIGKKDKSGEDVKNNDERKVATDDSKPTVPPPPVSSGDLRAVGLQQRRGGCRRRSQTPPRGGDVVGGNGGNGGSGPLPPPSPQSRQQRVRPGWRGGGYASSPSPSRRSTGRRKSRSFHSDHSGDGPTELILSPPSSNGSFVEGAKAGEEEFLSFVGSGKPLPVPVPLHHPPQRRRSRSFHSDHSGDAPQELISPRSTSMNGDYCAQQTTSSFLMSNGEINAHDHDNAYPGVLVSPLSQQRTRSRSFHSDVSGDGPPELNNGIHQTQETHHAPGAGWLDEKQPPQVNLTNLHSERETSAAASDGASAGEGMSIGDGPFNISTNNHIIGPLVTSNCATSTRPPVLPPPPSPPNQDERTARERLVERERQARLETERARWKRQMALSRAREREEEEEGEGAEEDNDSRCFVSVVHQEQDGGLAATARATHEQGDSEARGRVDGDTALKDESVVGTVGDTASHDMSLPPTPLPPVLPVLGDTSDPTNAPPLGFAMERFLSGGVASTPPQTLPPLLGTSLISIEGQASPPNDLLTENVMVTPQTGGHQSAAVVASSGSASLLSDLLPRDRNLSEDLLALAGLTTNNHNNTLPRSPDGATRSPHSVTAASSILSQQQQPPPSQQPQHHQHASSSVAAALARRSDSPHLTTEAASKSASVSQIVMESDDAHSSGGMNDLADSLPSHSITDDVSDLVGLDGAALDVVSPPGVVEGAPHSFPSSVPDSTSTMRDHDVISTSDDGGGELGRARSSSGGGGPRRMARLTEAEILEMNEIDYASIGNVPPRSLRDEQHLPSFPASSLVVAGQNSNVFSEGTHTTVQESVSVTTTGEGNSHQSCDSDDHLIVLHQSSSILGAHDQMSESSSRMMPSQGAPRSADGDGAVASNSSVIVAADDHMSGVTSHLLAGSMAPSPISSHAALDIGEIPPANETAMNSASLHPAGGGLHPPMPDRLIARMDSSVSRNSSEQGRLHRRAQTTPTIPLVVDDFDYDKYNLPPSLNDVISTGTSNLARAVDHAPFDIISPPTVDSLSMAISPVDTGERLGVGRLALPDMTQGDNLPSGATIDHSGEETAPMSSFYTSQSLRGMEHTHRPDDHNIHLSSNPNGSPVHNNYSSIDLNVESTGGRPSGLVISRGGDGTPALNRREIPLSHIHVRDIEALDDDEEDNNNNTIENGPVLLRHNIPRENMMETTPLLETDVMGTGAAEVPQPPPPVPREVTLGRATTITTATTAAASTQEDDSFSRMGRGGMYNMFSSLTTTARHERLSERQSNLGQSFADVLHIDSVFSDMRSVSTVDIDADMNDSDKYLGSGVFFRAFPERFLALFVSLIIEIPVLLMISGGNNNLCMLIGSKRYQLLMAFLPISCAISGNCGLQSSALTTRAVSHLHVEKSSYASWLLTEIGACVLLGLGMATLLGIVAYQAAGSDLMFGGMIFFAQFVSIVMSGVTGTLAPLLFTFVFRRDSGKWGGLLETAIQDVVGTFAMVVMLYRLLVMFGDPMEVDSTGVCCG